MSQVRGVSYAMAGMREMPEERIRVSSRVFVQDGEAGCGEEKPVYRAKPEDIQKNRRSASVSIRTALLVLGACMMFFGIMVVSNEARKTALTKQIDTMTSSISATVKENHGLNIEVVTARDSTRISYQAVQDLGMISAEGAETYYVVAPETRQAAAQTTSLPGTRSASSGSR